MSKFSENIGFTLHMRGLDRKEHSFKATRNKEVNIEVDEDKCS